jgi:hypothetical protein
VAPLCKIRIFRGEKLRSYTFLATSLNQRQNSVLSFIKTGKVPNTIKFINSIITAFELGFRAPHIHPPVRLAVIGLQEGGAAQQLGAKIAVGIPKLLVLFQETRWRVKAGVGFCYVFHNGFLINFMEWSQWTMVFSFFW